MKIQFEVSGLPPKKDGANSMWRKDIDFLRLKALRMAAAEVMKGHSLPDGPISLVVRVFSKPSKGDLDNFITGICDGLMAATPRTPIDMSLWEDVPESVRPNHPICYRDDVQIKRIVAERIEPENGKEHYSIELEW